MSDNIWEKNSNVLNKCHPELYKKINYADKIKSEIEISLEQAYTDELITAITVKGEKYYLAGKYSPNGMAERLAIKYRNTEYGSLFFVIGLSDGRLLQHLLECLEEDVNIVVYEPSGSLFQHTLRHYDCSAILESKSITWIVGKEKEELLQQVLSILLTADNMLNVKIIVQGNYDRLFPEEVKSAVEILNKCIKKLRVRWNTNIVFSQELINNVLKNAKYLYKHYSLNTLFDTLQENVPVIIIAAGPSLDKNIDELKNAIGKACMIACDTSLKPLLRHGIVPDFFYVVDPSKPLELFEDERVWNIPLISGLSIPAEIMRRHTGEKIIYLDSYFTLDMLNAVFGKNADEPGHAMSSVPTGGSVATSAFSVARLMGAKNIILVGQDLAFSGEKEHAEGTFKNDRKTTDISDDILVEDIYGNLIKTTKDFKLYLDWYQDEIKQYPDLNVIDATEGGAKIEGTKILDLHTAIEDYCTGSFDSESYLQNLPHHFNEQEQQLALDYMHTIQDRFRKIGQKIKDGEKWYKKLEQYSKKQTDDSKELQKILKKIKNVNTFMEEEQLTDLIMDGVKQEEYMIRTTMYKFDDDEQKNLLESAKMGLRLMEGMKATLKKMWPDIEELGRFNGIYENPVEG